MNVGPITMAITIATRPAIRTRTMPLARFSIEAGMPSSPTARDALTRIASPGRRRPPTSARTRRRRNPAALRRALRLDVGRAPSSPTAITQLDPELVHEGSDLVVVAATTRSRARPSRRGSPRGAGRRPLDEVEQRGPHRGGVGVVGVVDDEAAARQRRAPRRASGRARSRPRPPAPGRAAGRARRTRRARRGCSRPCALAVKGSVRVSSRAADREAPHVAGSLDRGAVEAADLDVVARRGTARARGRRQARRRSPPGGRAAIASAFAAATRSTVPDELEVLRADGA